MTINVPAFAIGFVVGVAVCAIALLIVAAKVGRKARKANGN